MINKLTIPIKFQLVEFQPDQRKYKTALPLLKPVEVLAIVVNVPAKSEYFDNMEAILMSDIAGDKTPSPLLTPKGLAYIEDELLNRIDNPEEATKSDNEKIEWEDE
jgi:hypothetical protein